MNDIKITLYHPTLDLISDRTLRDILKSLSSMGRNIQVNEIMHLINNSPLDASEKQSIRDRLSPELMHMHSYYVDKIEKGSLSVTITVTAFALWMLQNTIGESVKDAWKQTKFHKKIIDYLTTDLRKEIIGSIINTETEPLSKGRYSIDEIRKNVDTENNLIINVTINTHPVIEERILEKEKKVDANFIIENGHKKISEIDIENSQE